MSIHWLEISETEVIPVLGHNATLSLPHNTVESWTEDYRRHQDNLPQYFRNSDVVIINRSKLIVYNQDDVDRFIDTEANSGQPRMSSQRIRVMEKATIVCPG